MHDELLARRGVEVWVGAEPTFTRAESLEPAWLSAAEGDDKLARAHALAAALADRAAAAPRVTRVIGRQFPDETAPRFAFGVRWRDDRAIARPRRARRAAVDAEPVARRLRSSAAIAG